MLTCQMLRAGAAPWRARRRDGGQARVRLPPRSWRCHLVVMSNTGAAAGFTVGRAAGGTGGDADAWSCNEPLDGIKVVAVGVANPWKLLNLGDGVHLHVVAQCMPAADNEPCNSVSGSWPLYSVRDVLQHLPVALNVTAQVASGKVHSHGGTQPCIQAKSTRHPRGCVRRSPTIFLFIFYFFPVKIT